MCLFNTGDCLINKLLDELGLTNLMNPVPYDRYNGIFADTVNGWNSKGMDRIDNYIYSFFKFEFQFIYI
jgi:hypothetical protein